MVDQFGFDLIIVGSPFDGVGDGGEKHIRRRLLEMLRRRFYIRDFLTFISQHHEQAHLDPVLLGNAGHFFDTVSRHGALHGVQDTLRTTL